MFKYLANLHTFYLAF